MPGASTPHGLWRRVFPWPLVDLHDRRTAWALSAAILGALLASRLLLLANGPWEQDEALLACGVVDFDPVNHMPLPPAFPLWVWIGRLVRLCGVHDPLVALQLASAVLSVVGLWALVGLWEAHLGRGVALTGAALAAFLPGVWIHAGRGLSATPSAALAVVGVALWLRGGERGFVPGVVAMTAAALVRPPLAPFFVLAVLLATWGARRSPRLVAGGAVSAALFTLVVTVPAVLESGGWRLFYDTTITHASYHFGLLGTEQVGLASLGYVRGLGTPLAAAVFSVSAAIGWLSLRRRLGWRWWAGGLAALWLVFVLMFLHNRTYPRYWVLVWMVAAPLAVQGLRAVLRSGAAASLVAVAATALAGWWALPAVAYIHEHVLPPVAALRRVAEQRHGVLVFDDGLFSFRNLAARQGWLEIPSMRTSEINARHLAVGGDTLWFLAESPGIDVASATSAVETLTCREDRVRLLSQDRFLDVRLVRNPVLAWQGAAVPEKVGTNRSVWCSKDCVLLLPPLSGAGTVVLAVEVHELLGETHIEALVDGVKTLRTVVAGRGVLRVPIPPLPVRNALHQSVPLELRTGGEVVVPGDDRPLALRVAACSVAAPPYSPGAFSFFPDPRSLLAAAATGAGTYPPELMGDPPRPAAWAGPEAWFELPLGPGMVGLRLLAPRPGPVAVDIALGGSTARVVVGSSAVDVALPVPGDMVAAGWGRLVVRSATFVPGGGDERQLGVAIARVWFDPGG